MDSSYLQGGVWQLAVEPSLDMLTLGAQYVDGTWLSMRPRKTGPSTGSREMHGGGCSAATVKF